jgi:membrane protease subunit (stomatin/prohibitin family)
MATFFRNRLESEIGTTEVEVISVATISRVTVIGMSLTNLTSDIIRATIRVENTVASAPNDTAFYIKDVTIQPNQSLRVVNGGEKLVLAGDMKVYVQSNVADSMDFIASYVEIQ